jgi:hypothetical protein
LSALWLHPAMSDAFKLDKFVSCSRGTQIGTATIILFGLLVVEVPLHRKGGIAYTVLPRGCRWLNRRIAARFNIRTLKELMETRPEMFRSPPGPAPAPLLETLSRTAKGGNRHG